MEIDSNLHDRCNKVLADALSFSNKLEQPEFTSTPAQREVSLAVSRDVLRSALNEVEAVIPDLASRGAR